LAMLMRDILDVARDTIRTYRMISPRDTVLAAVSGGPDSICMLDVLLELRDEFEFGVVVAHLDHRFRGDESACDAEFVRRFAEERGVTCVCEEENVPAFLLCHAMSKQAAARMLRYRFLLKTSKLEYCQRIATGHTADDQAETVLMRVLRGAGPRGLSGIPPKRDGMVVRPLLGVWRSEVLDHLKARGIDYRTDSSNLGRNYLRNRIRHDLMPTLEEYNPAVRESLARLGAIMVDTSANIDRQTDAAFADALKAARVGQFALDSRKFGRYDRAVQRSILRRAFEQLRPDLAPLPFRHTENILSLARREETGAVVGLPGGARARLEHGSIVLSHGEGPPEFPEQDLPVPGAARFDDAGLIITAELLPASEVDLDTSAIGDDTALFDWDEIAAPLLVRPRREGDRFRPHGMEGTKSLKELFIDRKIAFSFRSAVPILCDRSGILWVVGLRRSAAAPVTTATRTVLAIRARTQEEQAETGQGTSLEGADPEEGR